jgi:hypothetical protein
MFGIVRTCDLVFGIQESKGIVSMFLKHLPYAAKIQCPQCVLRLYWTQKVEPLLCVPNRALSDTFPLHLQFDKAPRPQSLLSCFSHWENYECMYKLLGNILNIFAKQFISVFKLKPFKFLQTGITGLIKYKPYWLGFIWLLKIIIPLWRMGSVLSKAAFLEGPESLLDRVYKYNYRFVNSVLQPWLQLNVLLQSTRHWHLRSQGYSCGAEDEAWTSSS